MSNARPLPLLKRNLVLQVIVNNAGYIITCFFADSTVEAQIKNAETNAMSCIRITHHFLNKMLDTGVKVCIGFTSSPSGMISCPSSVMYGCIKAFLTEFGMSLAGEVYSSGIDVLVVRPSPTTGNSRFYDANKSSTLGVGFFRKTGGSPNSIAFCYLKGFGRTVVFDQGYFSLGAKLGLKLFDVSLLALMIQRVTHLGGDFKKLYKPRKSKQQPNANK
jgi:short-subunit dehydrogenase